MARPTQVFLFGDITVSFEQDLLQLLHSKDEPLLLSFFERAAFALREEIASLPAHQQTWFPRFTTLIDMQSNIKGKKGGPALKFALLCLCEIGLFMRHQADGSHRYPSGDSTCLLGICTGSFAAVAVGVSRSLSELIPAGIEASLVAFRTAMLSLQCQIDHFKEADTQETIWSAIVNSEEEDATKLIQRFDKEMVMNPASTPYVSAVSMTNVTVSAPPHILGKFLAASKLQSRTLPIESPYHAPHLFSDSTKGIAVKDFHDSSLSSYELRIPLLSPAGGHISASNFKKALQEVVSQTLRCQVRWDKVIESCRELLQQTQTNICEIVPVLSNAYQLLSTHISQNSGIKTNVNDAMKTGSIPRPSKPTGKFEQSKIAVTGFSGRYPDAASNEEFWLLLQEGRDVHRTVPEDRFDWKAHYDPTGKARNTSRVQYGCFIRDPGLFDTHFFHMSPREAASTDPAQRLLIMSTYEALEMAGFVPNRTPSTQVDRVGVFMGTTSDDWREVNSGQDVDTYFIPGGNRAFIPGRINYFFKFSGPSLSIDTACSSSFSAIHTACNYLWKGDCDTAVAGGTNILTNPDNFAGLDRGHFLSTTGNCNTFDDGANGYCRADAIGSVILKRYEDAIADNDPIFGTIIGAHTNHCGQAESITRPHEGDQASVFNRILRYSNQNPLDVSYVEMHGTGTQAGDATEMNSVLSCFVPEKQRMPHYPLHLGSVKANIGHAESASGVSSLIKVLLMMKNNQIPPHCGIKTKINHNYPLDLKDRNVHIASRSTEWNRRGCVNGKRMAFLNNFSAAGGNTALFLEDGPVRKSVEQQGNLRKMYPVAITAKSANALESNARAMLAYLKSNPDISPASLSYTTTARRTQHNFRTMVSGIDVKSIQNNLQKKLPDMPTKPIPSPALIPKVAFVFTGQGALYAGVGRELYESEASFRNNILRFDTIAQQQGFPSILPLVDGSVSEEQEAQPMIAHVGHTCIQMALCNLWNTWNISPSLVIGHSLGEYAAFYASGITTAADTIYLVGSRARLLSDSCSQGSHSMVSVKAPQSEVAGVTRRSSCEIACVNQPDGTVLSGPRQEIDHVTGRLEGLAKKCVKLYIPYAFHSAQIEPILEDFEKLASSVHFSKPSIPFLSPLLGSVIDEGSTLNAAYLTKACRHTVNFEAALEAAKESGTVTDKTIWLELGPHPLCSGMIKSTLGSQITTLPALEKRVDAWTSMVGALENLYTRGIEIDWNAYQRQVVCSHEVLELPRYSWDLKNYWIPYRNNFCLTKGDVPEPQAAARKGLEAEPASIITPSVQRIVEFDRDTSSIVIESDINHLALTGVLQGHNVNGVALCPSSLYADMAMTIVNQIFKMKDMPTDSVRLDVSDMKVGKPLVANGSTLLRVSASIDWNVRIALLSYYGVSSNGKKLADHATCQTRISDGTSWTEEWSRLSFLINHRVCALQDSVNAGTAHKMKRGIVYKLFSSLVEYSEGYRGMEEVILDSGELEATAKINFRAGDEGFHLNPQWIDSLGHIAGFVMNANDSVASKDTVFVNHGWDGMKIWTKLSNNKTYRTYNKMELTTNNLYVGNTYILEGSQIVAVFSGVKFQGVPRRVLDQLLPAGGRTAQGTTPAAAKLSTAAKEEPSTGAQQGLKQGPKTESAPAPTKPKQHSSKPQSTVNNKIMNIIAEEAGVEVGDLKPETPFDECGVDSLLSLNISNTIQDQLGIQVGSSVFAEYPTVGELLRHLGGEPDAAGAATPATESSDPSSAHADSIFDDDSSASTLASSEDIAEDLPERGSADKTMAVIKAVIAEEIGLEASDLAVSTSFADLGIDSLLTLNIMSKLEEVLGDELPKSLLTENETLDDIEKSLGLRPKKTTNREPIRAKQAPKEKEKRTSKEREPPYATAHLLQGNSKTASKNLFLLPDGSGSAFSYAKLSAISPSVAVYGLSCPWQKDPWSMVSKNITFSDLSIKFINAIRKVQPSGPYHLGGWSAGGISAYDITQQLFASGEETANLILLDSPNPIGLENPPQRMYDFFDQLDFFGMQGKKPPKWLRAHFDAFLSILDEYKVSAWKEGKAPKTHIVYAKDGVCSNLKPEDPRPEIRDDDPREMKWLLNTRTDFNAEGWKSLVGEKNVRVAVLQDVHHFSLVEEGPMAKDLAAFIRTAMGE